MQTLSAYEPATNIKALTQKPHEALATAFAETFIILKAIFGFVFAIPKAALAPAVPAACASAGFPLAAPSPWAAAACAIFGFCLAKDMAAVLACSVAWMWACSALFRAPSVAAVRRSLSL